MPQECMRLSVFLTASGLSTRSPVIGQRPPLARVAAMTLALSHVTSMEHSWRSTHKKEQFEFSKWEQMSGKEEPRQEEARLEAAFPRNPS